MLFARFLAENNLLMYPDPDDPVAVTLEECEDFVADEGAANGWELSARFAARMLPQIYPSGAIRGFLERARRRRCAALPERARTDQEPESAPGGDRAPPTRDSRPARRLRRPRTLDEGGG